MNERQAQFQTLVRQHEPAIYRLAFSLSHSRDAAQDLAQETLLRAWRSFDQLHNHAKAKSWHMTIVRREYARGLERYRPMFASIDPEELSDNGVERVGDIEFLDLCDAIEDLPEILRETLLLRSIFGYSASEIACQFDIPKETVNSRLFRARHRLRVATEE